MQDALRLPTETSWEMTATAADPVNFAAFELRQQLGCCCIVTVLLSIAQQADGLAPMKRCSRSIK
jgi:hypothetical protein